LTPEREPTLPYLLFFLVVAVAILWIPPLWSSLWLDELDTYFSARDGIFTAISRTSYVHPQCSQLYNAFLAAWMGLVGAEEPLLRLPSTLAMALAAYFVYRLGRLLADRETGVLAALAFVTMRDVIFSAADARSYAMATAAAVGSTEAWLRLLAPPSLYSDASIRGGTSRQTVVYAIAAALTVYFHQLYGLVLLVHAGVGAWLIARGGARATALQAFAAVVATAVLAAGEIPNLVATFTARARFVHAAPPPPEYLAYLWGAPMFVVAILPVVLLIAARKGNASYRLPNMTPLSLLLLVMWAIVPPLVLFVISRTTETRIFVSRYYLSCQPAIALLLGVLLRGFEPARLRVTAVGGVVAVALLLHARTHHGLEDWRGVAAVVNQAVEDDTLVFVDAGFVEASNPDWLGLPPDDERRRFLLAPLEYYPFRGEIVPLPYRLNETTRDYVETAIVARLLASDRFVAIGRGKRSRWWRGWLDGRLADTGFTAVPLHDGIYLEATLFERDADGGPARRPK
jgi:hypothetical protein